MNLAACFFIGVIIGAFISDLISERSQPADQHPRAGHDLSGVHGPPRRDEGVRVGNEEVQRRRREAQRGEGRA